MGWGLYQAAHVTPHAWGIEAFYELLLEDGGLVDILPYLGILLAFAVVFYALAVWRLRTVLTRYWRPVHPTIPYRWPRDWSTMDGGLSNAIAPGVRSRHSDR